MPVPSGSWAEHYGAKQRAYNLHLVAGLALSIVTLFYVSIFLPFCILKNSWLNIGMNLKDALS